MRLRCSFFPIICILLCFSCKTAPEQFSSKTAASSSDKEEVPEKEQNQLLTLLFGGDIMAHQQNYNMGNYSEIWESISPLVKNTDFSFANIEFTVDDNLPYSAFPDFNVHHDYPEAAISAGFNVFSLVNNHTNDYGLKGMKSTLAWSEKITGKYAAGNRPVYFSGLNEKENEGYTYQILKKNGWTILFCAVTEILNRPAYSSYMNFVAPDKETRKSFCTAIRAMRTAHPCDLFIISIHCNEPEYVHAVSKSQRTYYYQLLDSGADIIWANHPHIIKGRELIGNKADGKLTKIIMFANGNTISGQRHDPQLENPYNERENTGDGLLLSVTYKKNIQAYPEIVNVHPYYITTYIDTNRQFVIKNLDDTFVSSLRTSSRLDWAAYLVKRKKIIEEIKEIKTWL